VKVPLSDDTWGLGPRESRMCRHSSAVFCTLKFPFVFEFEVEIFGLLPKRSASSNLKVKNKRKFQESIVQSPISLISFS
jgi:hypothetical protein